MRRCLAAQKTLPAPASIDPFTVARRTGTVRLLLTAGAGMLALAASFAVRFAFYAMHMTVGV